MLTVLVVTSAVRSNPDLTCIQFVLKSLHRIKGLFPEAKLRILADGFKIHSEIPGAARTNFKKSLIDEQEAERYRQYLDNLEQLIKPMHYAELSISEKNVGFAGLVKRAVCEQIDTPLVMVVQHDWAFRRKLDLSPIVDAFQRDEKLNYLTWSSNSTINYPIRLKEMYSSFLKEDCSSIEPINVGKLKCWPLDFFYDRNHIARTEFYRKRVFQTHVDQEEKPKDMRVKRFIEDSLGHHILNLSKEIGPWNLFEQWGLACVVEDDEMSEPLTFQSNLMRPKGWKPVLLHLDARKFLTNDVLSQRLNGNYRKKVFFLDSDSDCDLDSLADEKSVED
jgi:hypothetical protein